MAESLLDSKQEFVLIMKEAINMILCLKNTC